MEELNPWTRKIPWSRKWQLTPIFLTGKSHGQRSLVGCSPGCRKKLDMTERLSTYTYISQVPSKGTEISLKISEIEGVCHIGNGRAMRSNWGWWNIRNSRRHYKLQAYYKVKRFTGTQKTSDYKLLEPFRDHFVRAEGGIWGLPEKGGEIPWLLP